MARERSKNDIYRRLISQGTDKEEIESVYRKLRKAGYGEESARSRLEAGRRQAQREERAAQEYRGHEGGGARMDDWFPRVDPTLRRRVNKWAHQNDLLAVGLRERWHDFVSHVRPGTPDRANRRLLEALAIRTDFRSGNPYRFSLATTYEALHTISRILLGRARMRNGEVAGTSQEIERSVGDALRRRDPFAHEYLSRFARHDDALRESLAYVELAVRSGMSMEVQSLARITRETYRLVLTTASVPRGRVEQILNVARDALAATTKVAGNVELDESLATFLVCVENLERFRVELYPIVLKAIQEFYDLADESAEKARRITTFAGVKESEILSVRRFYEEEAKRRERALAAQQSIELESIERSKDAGFAARFAGVLTILDALFPDSGIGDVERNAFLVPYFDERVFIHSLAFDRTSGNVELLSAYDPLQPILVFHRIIDNLINAIDHVRLERVLGHDGLAQTFAAIKDEWAEVYASIFDPYLRTLAEYARGVSDESYARHFANTRAARSIEETIAALRNRTIRNYGHAPTAADTQIRLWSVAERLTLLLDEIGDEFNQDVAQRTDPLSKRIYEQLASGPVVDFKTHATPGTAEFKPVIRQLRRYIEAKYHSSLSSVPRVAQLFLFDVLRGVAELYRSMTNEETSFLRAAGAAIVLAGESEAQAWHRERDSRAGELGERLRVRLDEHLVSEYTDALTGMKTKNFYLNKLPRAFEKLVDEGKSVCVVMIDIDHFKWVNDELGHQTGDEVLRDAATTVLDGIRRGSDVAIRFGGEELLIVTPAPFHHAITLAERLRLTQERSLTERDIYAPIAAIGTERGEPCGSFSIGVARRESGETLDTCVARADAALYESKKSRNAVTISHRDSSLGARHETFASYATRVRAAKQ